MLVTWTLVRGFLGQPQLESALTGMDLVIIPAGVPRKPGMTRDDLFKINAGIVKTLCEGIAKSCPNTIVNFSVLQPLMLSGKILLWQRCLELIQERLMFHWWEVMQESLYCLFYLRLSLPVASVQKKLST